MHSPTAWRGLRAPFPETVAIESGAFSKTPNPRAGILGDVVQRDESMNSIVTASRPGRFKASTPESIVPILTSPLA
jgi:hypothetical protein